MSKLFFAITVFAGFMTLQNPITTPVLPSAGHALTAEGPLPPPDDPDNPPNKRFAV